MKTINYESDFKLIEGFKDGSSILAAPFRFTYYTKVARGVHVAEYNGSEYVNCTPMEDGRVIVPFDNPQLGMGLLNVKREFFLNDADFADGVCNLVSVESTGIILNNGATCDSEVVTDLFPFYQQGADGKSAYQEWLDLGREGTAEDFIASLRGDKGDKGSPFTYDDLTDGQKHELVSLIDLPVSDFLNGSAVDMETDTTGIDALANMLTNEKSTAIAVVAGKSLSDGGTRINLASGFIRKDKYFFTDNPIGANVGDLVLVTKILGITRLQILPVQDAKPREDNYEPTMGVVSGEDKARINKIDNIAAGAADTRNWLSSVNDMVERNLHRTRYRYGTKLDECIYTGVCAYTPDTILDIAENWTVFVDCSSDGDGSGYYHFLQTAVCRTGDKTGKIFRRLGWYKKEGDSIIDLNFLDWN